MKSEQQIKDRLNAFLADDRVFNKNGSKRKSATVFENAPLALIQLDIESMVKTLKWVLSN